MPTTYGTYREIAARSRSFERLAVADRWQPALVAIGGDPERLTGDRVSADYFRVLGVAPAFGRDFDAADDQQGAPLVAVVSAGLAARRFGDARILGSSIVLDGVAYTVIGVMPTGFRNALAPTAEVWTPLQFRAPRISKGRSGAITNAWSGASWRVSRPHRPSARSSRSAGRPRRSSRVPRGRRSSAD